MRLFIILNGVLMSIASALFAVDLLLDGYSLLGTKMRAIDIQGKCMAEFIVGQPVVPSQISILQKGDFIALWYMPSVKLWHEYRSFEVSFINEHESFGVLRGR